MESRATRDWIALVRQRPGARTLSRDVAAELADHLEDIYMSGIRAGRSEADAVALAIAELDQARFDELIARPRATRPAASRAPQQISPAQSRWWTGVQFDLRDALRSARRQPAFTVSVIAILGIAIGAATAAFSVMDAVLWRPLPYPAAGRLIVLTHMTPAGEGRSHAAADWRDYAARHEDMAALAAYSRWPLNLTGAGEPQRLHSVIVSGNFFDVLGRPAALGRTIRPADDTAAADPVVVVSRQFWLRQFGGDPSVVGRQIVLNARAATIVGIMPGEFAIPDRDTDIWMPMGLPPSLLDDRGSEWLSIIGRLRRGVDLTRVQSAMDRTAAALAEAFPATNAGERENLRPLLDDIVGPARRSLWLGALAVAIVLLGGCANAASLMIARATLRRDEIAIRSALGAEPLRIARQLLVESVLLAGAGGALGVGLAFAFDRAFLALPMAACRALNSWKSAAPPSSSRFSLAGWPRLLSAAEPPGF
jgi:putative ABC transport system permease protein